MVKYISCGIKSAFVFDKVKNMFNNSIMGY